MKTEGSAEELNLVKLAKQYSDETKARRLLESIRWPNGPVCPHCKNGGTEDSKSIYTITPKAKSDSPARKGLYKCGACRKQFSVTVGTIFEASHIAISTWLMAIFILCSSKKAISAHQLHRMLDITYKSAWFMSHRIRFAMGPDMPLGKLLAGTVEVDETWIGGKAPPKTKFENKSTVVALIERGGQMRARVVPSVTQKNLRQCLNECVSKSAVVNTDEHAAYRGIDAQWKAHHAVNHSKFEYAKQTGDGVAHVNSCESFFSLLKRGVHGAWHHVSKEHLPKYANEFAFRWNHRSIKDGERLVQAIMSAEGKRLTYKPLTQGGKSE